MPVAELLARPVPTLHSPSVGAGRKSSNFLQVPEIEAPRPKSVILQYYIHSTHNTFESPEVAIMLCPGSELPEHVPDDPDQPAGADEQRLVQQQQRRR